MRKKPLQLVFICNSPSFIAGVEKTVFLLLDHLNRDLVSPRIIVNGEGDFAAFLRERKENCEVISASKIQWISLLKYSLNKQPADVVQLHLTRINAFFLSSWRIPTIERLNMTRHKDYFYPMRWQTLDCFTSSWITKFIVVSKILEKQFIHRGYNPEKLTVIHNGIDIFPKISSGGLRKQLGLPEDTLIIGAACRLTRQKGVDTLLTAAALLLKDGIPLHVVIAGDGELRRELHDQAVQLGIENIVHFLGFQQDIIRIIAEFNVIVCLSYWEPFSNTILEAMSVGTPIVASDVGGNSEAIRHGYNGLLVPKQNPEEAKESIKRILKHPSLAKELADHGKKEIENFSISKMVRAHEDVYQEVYEQQARKIPNR